MKYTQEERLNIGRQIYTGELSRFVIKNTERTLAGTETSSSRRADRKSRNETDPERNVPGLSGAYTFLACLAFRHVFVSALSVTACGGDTSPKGGDKVSRHVAPPSGELSRSD